MKCMVLGLALWGCASGGSADVVAPGHFASEVSYVAHDAEPLPTEEDALRAMMLGPVTLGGIVFADRACAQKFGQARLVPPGELDGLARCLAGLRLQPSARKSSRDHTVVESYAPGFELEAFVAEHQLGYVGFAARGGATPDVPTITPETLESLRTAGEAHPTVSLAQRRYLEICVFPGSETPKVYARSVIPADELHQLGAAIGDWRFRAFATPACAVVAFDPVNRMPPPVERIPRALTFAKSGKPQRTADAGKLEALRVGGSRRLSPEIGVRAEINRDQQALHHEFPIVSAFEVCFDEDGRFESGTMLKSTGYRAFDVHVVHTLQEWTFHPYVEDGTPQPICATITTTYRQAYQWR